MYFKKYSATNTINDLANELDKRNTDTPNTKLSESADQLRSYMKQIVNETTDQRLKDAFMEVVSP